MRVFSVEMLVKEEGAAVVEAALKRLKNEAKAVAAEMKVTTSNVTNTGTAMKAAGQATEIAKDRAAKAAIGFAAVGQAIGRTGSLTADMGTRIVEAGSQMSAMFGPTGLVVSAVLAGLAAIGTRLFQTRKEAEDFKKRLDEMTDTANLRGLQDELDKLVKGTASQRGRDSIVALAQELVRLQEEYKKYANATGPATSAQIALEKRINELRATLARKRDQITEIQQRMVVAADAERYHTEVVDAGKTATDAATEADRQRKEALDALTDAIERNARARQAIQEREERAEREAAARRRQRTGPPASERPEPWDAQTGNGQASRQMDAESLAASLGISFGAMQAELASLGIDVNQQLLDFIKFDTFKFGVSSGIEEALKGGLISGIQAAIATGNIGDAFQAMGQAIVSSLASSMVEVALAAISFGDLLAKIQTFMAAHPALAVASAIALLALARSMGGSARTAPMMATGGAGGLTYSAAGGMSAPTQQIIFGATSATTAAGMQPRQAMNVTIIGPNDPNAQRQMQELMAKANSRGRVG
jgi:hypothetical protein